MATGKGSAVVNQMRRRIGAETVAGLPEWQLVERFATTGDESAFEAIVARFGPMILGVCRRVLSDEADVDDAFQATFFVLVRKSRTLGRSVALGHWLYGVAYRVALRARADARRRRSRERFGAPVECRPQHYEDDPARFEIAGVLDTELSKLSTKYRAPIVLCYFEGLTHEEAALRLGWPVGSVKGRLARARDLLRHRLTRRGLTLATGAVATALSGEAATVPVALGWSTCRAAVQLASGKVAGGAVAASVALLLRQELRSLFLASCKTVGVGLLLFVAGASLLSPLTKIARRPQMQLANETPGTLRRPPEGTHREEFSAVEASPYSDHAKTPERHAPCAARWIARAGEDGSDPRRVCAPRRSGRALSGFPEGDATPSPRCGGCRRRGC